MSKDFFDAIRAGDRDKVNAMLAADPTLLAAKDEKGNSAFVTAKYAHRNDIAVLLLELGIELDFFAATMAGAGSRVKELIDAEPTLVTSYSHDGWTPLHLAAFFAQPSVADALLAHGADVNARARNGTTNMPLHAGAAGRNLDVVRALVEHGADVNARQEGGCRPRVRHRRQSSRGAVGEDLCRHEGGRGRPVEGHLGRRPPARHKPRPRQRQGGRQPADCGQGPRGLPGICRHRNPVRRPAGRARTDRRQDAAKLMPAFDADSLAAWTGGRWSGRPASEPTGFSVDSRRLSPGQAFVALRTGRRDGHDFLGAALEAGAAAAIVARACPKVALAQLVVDDPLGALQAVAREHRRRFQGTVAGITGSAGKTSTKELLALLLGGEDAGVLATESNLNNQIGVALTLTRLDPARHRCAVVEAGISAPGEMRALAAMIDPDVALVTLVGPAHLAGLGGLDSVAREKAVLAGSIRKGGFCVFPSS